MINGWTLRQKVSFGIVICALLLWFCSMIPYAVFTTGLEVDESRIWCDTHVPASVQNVTEVFADFEISCLATIAYQQAARHMSERSWWTASRELRQLK